MSAGCAVLARGAYIFIRDGQWLRAGLVGAGALVLAFLIAAMIWFPWGSNE